MFHLQNARKNHDIQTDNIFFENGMKFKYLEMAITDQNYIYKEYRKCYIQFRFFCPLISYPI